MRVAASYDVAAGTRVLPGPRSSKAMVPCCTASLKTAVAFTPATTSVAPGAGMRLVRVGSVVSVTLSAKTTSTQ